MATYFIIKKQPTKKGAQRYQTRIKVGSRFVKTKTFSRFSDADDWGAAYKSNLENFRTDGKQPCTVTFERLAKEYLLAWSGTDAIRGYSVTTFARHFGSKNIGQISTADCRKVLAKWQNKKPATYNKHRAILSAIFDFARLQEEETGETYISDNPVKKVRNKPVDNLRVRYLSDDEKKHLVAACREIGGRFYLAFLLGLSTGLRKSNVLNLRWSDVDFTRGLLIIHRTKNGDPITQPVPPAIMEMLKSQRQIGRGLIFESEVKPGVSSDYKKQWIQARKDAGVIDFNWHDLRHDVASTMAMAGRSMAEIAHVLGHRSLQSTQRYTHLSTSHKAEALQSSVGKALEGVL